MNDAFTASSGMPHSADSGMLHASGSDMQHSSGSDMQHSSGTDMQHASNSDMQHSSGSVCQKCRSGLSSNDIGLYKKLINRGSTKFLCKHCLAEEFRIPEPLLDEKIIQFRDQGCTLFV